MSAGASVAVVALAMVCGGSMVAAVTRSYEWWGMAAAAVAVIVGVALFAK